MSLPSGYTQLEYIQSSGKQYIDTGVIVKDITEIKVDFQAVTILSGENQYASSWVDYSNHIQIGIKGNTFMDSGGVTYSQTSSVTARTQAVGVPLGAVNLHLYLFAQSESTGALHYSSGRIFSCQITTADGLVRNFVPCKNPDGVIGLYDLVNNQFYQNAGSGSFVAGAEVKGSHKTLIDGTWYDLKAGKCLVGGTAYSVKNGRVLVNSTGYNIPFSSGIPLSTITPGAILYLNESGSPVPFYIAKHDYESGLNGAGRTLVVRKDCYNDRVFGNNNAYANSNLDSWLCNTYLKLLDANIKAAIGTTKFYYTIGNGNNTVTTLQRAVFQLSLTELGKSYYYANTEGSALPIASALQIAYRNGSAVTQWTRTPSTGDIYSVCCLYYSGDASSNNYGSSYGSRPAFTLPGSLGLAQNPDGTYTIAA